MKLIPFKFLPSSWKLSGIERDKAEARYTLSGIDLDIKLAELEYTDDPVALNKEYANINKNHGIYDDYQYELALLIATIPDDKQLKIASIELDVQFDKIDKKAAEKEIATINEEPWVSIVDEGLDKEAGPSGYFFVFDWNELWIQMLLAHGYEGKTEDEIMEKWFSDVCRAEVMNNTVVPFNTSVIYD